MTDYWGIGIEKIKRVIGVHCPVDITVHNGQGEPVASVINNQANYYNSEFGEVIIIVDGDEKWICLPCDQSFEVSLSATDAGELEFEVYDLDLTSDDVIDDKSFTGVTLTDGKKMTSLVNTSDVDAAKLLVTDGRGDLLSEVHENGTETELTDDPYKAALFLQYVVAGSMNYTPADAATMLR